MDEEATKAQIQINLEAMAKHIKHLTALLVFTKELYDKLESPQQWGLLLL